MSFTQERITFPSSDGKNTVSGRIFVPVGSAVNGVIQISHGMIDHIGRYYFLIDALTARGYAVAGNDHLGHGDTADTDEDLGFFADKNGVGKVVYDLYTMNEYLRQEFPSFKPVMMGHSMGSFLSRLYVRKYPDTVSGHIIHGTGGPMGVILPLGQALVNTLMLFRGKKHRSALVKKMAFMGYNSKFEEENCEVSWLTRDIARVSGEDRNEYTTFTFTLSAYRDLFRMVGWSNSRLWFKDYPKAMPTLVMSGDMDPVGSYGKGPRYVYDKLISLGATDTTLKLYEGARHELFNETCRDEVFLDMKAWLSGVRK